VRDVGVTDAGGGTNITGGGRKTKRRRKANHSLCQKTEKTEKRGNLKKKSWVQSRTNPARESALPTSGKAEDSRRN